MAPPLAKEPEPLPVSLEAVPQPFEETATVSQGEVPSPPPTMIEHVVEEITMTDSHEPKNNAESDADFEMTEEQEEATLTAEFETSESPTVETQTVLPSLVDEELAEDVEEAALLGAIAAATPPETKAAAPKDASPPAFITDSSSAEMSEEIEEDIEEAAFHGENASPAADVEEEEVEERSMISAAEIARNLREARKDWQPENHPALPVNQSILGAAPTSGPMVTIVTDPFHINTLDIQSEQIELEQDLDRDLDEDVETVELEEIPALPPAEAEAAAAPEVSEPRNEEVELEQTESEEIQLPVLELREDSAETEAELSRIAATLAANEQAREKILEAQVSQQDAEEAAARLAREIAEDIALAQEMARAADEQAEADAVLIAAMPRLPEQMADGSLDLAELQSCLEALFFMSDKPLSKRRLKELLTMENGADIPLENFDEALASMITRYKHPCHGFELAEVAGGFQFRTKAGRAPLAKKLAKIQTQRLSSGAMETLAIVAYKQPVMKEDVDQIRGVDSSHFIRTLLDRKLIMISGRSELTGRPMLYGTTAEFMELFALKDLEAMPPLRELESMIPNSESGNPDDEDPRVKQMRKLVSQMNSDGSVSLIYDPKKDDQFLSDIREKVKGISITTAYLDEQKAAEDAVKLAAKENSAVVPPAGLEGFAPTPEPKI